MTFRHVFMVKQVRQTVMGWILHSSTYYQMCVGSCSYVPSCLVSKAPLPKAPERVMLFCCGESSSTLDQGPRSLP
jgi:hypothetical protein